jgi:RNA polymerase sigma-70 factor (ECF subfamily)
MERARTRLAADEVRTALAGLRDEDVVRRVVGGDLAMFEVLMRRYNQRVYRTVRSLLRDEREAEDAMQQAWLNAFTHIAQFEGASSFSTWLTRIALNEALGRVRQRSRLMSVPEVPEEEMAFMRGGSEDPERRAGDRELAHMVEEAVDELPDIYRTVFMLRELEGLSTSDAAEALGVSEEVVKVRLHRARGTLRNALYERAGAAGAHAFSFMGHRCDRMVNVVLSEILARTA